MKLTLSQSADWYSCLPCDDGGYVIVLNDRLVLFLVNFPFGADLLELLPQVFFLVPELGSFLVFLLPDGFFLCKARFLDLSLEFTDILRLVHH